LRHAAAVVAAAGGGRAVGGSATVALALGLESVIPTRVGVGGVARSRVGAARSGGAVVCAGSTRAGGAAVGGEKRLAGLRLIILLKLELLQEEIEAGTHEGVLTWR
jgi:hypothetical protein